MRLLLSVFYFPLMHHCLSINAISSLPLFDLPPVFPHTWPWEMFAERSYSEAPTGRKLGRPFIQKKVNRFAQKGLSYFKSTLAPLSCLTSYLFFKLAPLHNCPSSTMSFPHLFTYIYLFLCNFLFEFLQGNDHILLQNGILPSTMQLSWVAGSQLI